MSQYAKAIYGTIAAVIGSLALLLTGDEGFTDISTREWLIVAGEALAVGGIVFGVKNKTKLDTTTY